MVRAEPEQHSAARKDRAVTSDVRTKVIMGPLAETTTGSAAMLHKQLDNLGLRYTTKSNKDPDGIARPPETNRDLHAASPASFNAVMTRPH